VAHFRALLGDHDLAERHLRISMRQVDEEASMLLLCSRIAATAIELGLHDMMVQLTSMLTPYAHHVAVDSNVWWCDGPVSLTLAALAHAEGDDAVAASHLVHAEATAHSMGDARSLARIASLRAAIDPRLLQGVVSANAERHGLTEREVQVLRMIISGATNPEIARTLSYSPSTIRNDATAIYRKLGVRTRPEAAAKAISLGLI
jgi:DNA-binding CsgD family transcriptional regulator